MKQLYITGLILALLGYSLKGFSQGAPVQAQQNQSQPVQSPQNQRPQSPVQQTPVQQAKIQPAQSQRNQSPAPPVQQMQQSPVQASPQMQSQSQNQTQGQAQNSAQRRLPPRQRAAEAAAAAAANNNTPNLTERAKIKNEVSSKAPEHVVWLREMYRNIDLDKEDNAALYYPVTPIGDRMNLFTTIFKLLADNKIVAYNYPANGTEVFTEKEKLNFEDVLKKFQILYKKDSTSNNVRYIVDDADIPSNEVLMYQIKEEWYFDAATGTYKSQVIAICPLLVRQDYNVGDITTNPLCWIPYENLRPYLSRTMIMTSNYNNVLSYSIDDFFTKGMYKGDIVKTVNMKDQSLAQQVGDDPVRLKHAQDSIENQLKTFKERLWVHSDTTQQVAATNKGKKGTPTSRSTSSSSSVKKESAQKEEKPKAAKAAKTSTSPTKTVRRTR